MSKRTWYSMKKAGDKAGEINIYGEIGASFWGEDCVSATDFGKDLKALGELDTLMVHINSPGGDVADGIEIHNMLKDNSADVTVLVDGIAASAASYIAMAADKRVMHENTFMLVHEPATIAWGTADEMKAAAADLDRMTETFSATYSKASGQTADAVKVLMKEDRLMDAAEAKKLGYATSVVEAVTMTASFKLDRLPPKSRAQFKAVVDKATADATTAAATAAAAKAKLDADATAAAAAAAGSGSNVVSLDAARGEGNAAAMAYATEVSELCELAGKPSMIAGFMRDKTPIADVRKKLADARAKGGGDDIAGQHRDDATMGGGGAKVDPVKMKAGWAKATDQVNATMGFSK
jgi:ATP-dependent protease ClpP protease subunit